ncbi:hypothetical protein [Paraburkholderia acidiphila]|uniref:Uncharacterized protein n=1 Tax=Paraburkholderia acidiphila TaxID=2571747 RepID=A0A7Z2G4J1_9BURK|nr:hypothetical protein [Paraburkholderia acidiphila]QGZ55107.1 hypothetical protein FAZ97_09350 [Paraburkholderia acidiphila]
MKENDKQQNNEQNARSKLTLVKKVGKAVALNMIPGYPLVGAIKSFRETTTPGAIVIADLAKRLPQKRKGKRVRTWNQAFAARPADALPLREIERLNTRAKHVFMVLGFLGLCSNLGCAVNLNRAGLLSGGLFVLVCLMQIFKFELRLRQMETGPQNPDQPLMSPREFLRGRGFVKHFFNPRIDWK